MFTNIIIFGLIVIPLAALILLQWYYMPRNDKLADMLLAWNEKVHQNNISHLDELERQVRSPIGLSAEEFNRRLKTIQENEDKAWDKLRSYSRNYTKLVYSFKPIDKIVTEEDKKILLWGNDKDILDEEFLEESY